jgi:hypothetical protein
MLRFLVLLLLAVALWLFLESRLAALRRRIEESQRARFGERRNATAPTELLVRCSSCGTYIPQSRARLEGDRAYCQPACRQPDRLPAS